MSRAITSFLRYRGIGVKRAGNGLRARLSVALMVASLIVPALAGAQEPQPDDLGAETRNCFALADEEICIGEESYRADVCAAIATYAQQWRLPEGFFARLIWQESRFDPAALSPAGAQGIAQFMPSTGRLRNLADPFDPAEALARSAEYLDFLKERFGNLGLAAAAYNGGEGRMARYIANNGGALPLETRNYVRIITGRAVESWLGDPPSAVDYTLDAETGFQEACLDMAQAVEAPNLSDPPAAWQPWGVLIAQRAAPDMARAGFERVRAEFAGVFADEEMMMVSVRNPNFGNALRYSAMVGRPTRGEANAFCDRLQAAGGTCVVRKNDP